ncbi:MAG: Putative cytochrome C-type biogenesis protein [uncultured Sulfurovum sp.]|uniref:Cytochrome C-type biogenesis protein n=1 Tax=uncultured Sulfurovum sp. TaxID=269237 RepID=A0A6S6T2S3_9BACT|nr:MAG: Putative cytochrome C-type biogenesis protein [uncultured Sulfurovum sp.]
MLYTILTSYRTMIILLFILALGAATGTFIENDFGTQRARELVYNAWWYELALFLISMNLLFVIGKTKMYRVKARTLFHVAFVIILFGAALTRYFGFDGVMHIREGEKSNSIVIGEHTVETPFYIALKDFTLTRYPGSRSPSEFSSAVTLLDEINDVSFDTDIYMNNTLNYKGYKFFQTSYDTDEKGTKLTVNKDPGVEVTYIGYALLFLGLILNLFDKQSRFQFLIRKIKSMPIASFLLPLTLLLMQTPSYAQYTPYIERYLQEHTQNSKALANAFGTLVVQGPVGRMKPLDTQNREVLNKLTGKSSWEGMNANQVILGMFSRPELWKKINIIKVKTPKLRSLLGVPKNQKLVKFTDFFDANATYKLGSEVERANALVPSRRGTYDRDLIRVDERLNIVFMSYRGVLLTLFPLEKNARNKWVDFKTMFSMVDHSQVKRSTSRLLDIVYNRNYTKGFTHIEDIRAYQKEFGASVMPTQNKLDVEVWFNDTALFFKLSMGYLLFGLLLLIYSIGSMFTNRHIHSKVKTFASSIAIIFFTLHTFGLALRWYIGGYAPISNTYETMIYIAYASIFAGVLFLRKSTIALSAAFMLAGIFIFAAYLGEIDPEITNLVPVLKSYWLSIHVSVITASYGFFGVGAILGLITLVLFMLRTSKRPHIDMHIRNITYINEVALSLGLVLLVIGNFLGGIWANESWGRYWGWDPKETWAYISILVYVIVLHIRLIKKIYTPYLFSVLSVLSFASILMTYFGVNFYLAGMHSYATGDPVPIPSWVYITGGIVMTMMVMAYPKRKLIKGKS